MPRRNEAERLAELEKKMEQLKAKKQRLQAELNQKERKARTRELIQIGAIYQKYFDLENVEHAEQLAKKLKKIWEELN